MQGNIFINELNTLSIYDLLYYYYLVIYDSIYWSKSANFFYVELKNWFLNYLEVSIFFNYYDLSLYSAQWGEYLSLKMLPEAIIFLVTQSNLYYLNEYTMLAGMAQTSILKTALVSYNFTVFWLILNYSCGAYIAYYILVSNFFNSQILISLQNSLIWKLIYMFEGEEEVGAFDDLFTVVVLFLVVFGWFFLLSLWFVYIFQKQLILFGIGLCLLISFTLLTPTSVLIDLGVSFAAYVRGASSSASLIVECIFDIIGTLVVFTRFIVQNIRFLLIFFAYFELYEWIYSFNLYNNISLIFNENTATYLDFSINWLNSTFIWFFYYLSFLFLNIIAYLYYFVHLLILVFIQVSIYVIISFWLFFFFFTPHLT